MKVVFKYKYYIPMAILMVFVGIGACALAAFVFQDSNDFNLGYKLLFLMIALFFSIGAVGFLRGWSSVIIDETGISRSFFGKIWRVILWNNVLVIKSFYVPNMDVGGKPNRKISIYPNHLIKKPLFLKSSKAIAIDARFGDFDRLIELLNVYISKYQIKTEILANGKRTQVNQL